MHKYEKDTSERLSLQHHKWGSSAKCDALDIPSGDDPFFEDIFFSYSLGHCVVSVSSDVSILASIPEDCSFQLCIGCIDDFFL